MGAPRSSVCRRSSGSAAPTGSCERISMPRSARCRRRTGTSWRRPSATSSRPRERRSRHRVSDLADYTERSPAQIEDVVDRLAGDVRILRPAGDGRYEIYHDALAGPIVDWSRRWEEGQERRRERRRIAIAGGIAAALAAIAVVVTILAVLAWQARQDARRGREDARRGQSRALAGQAIASLDTDAPRALRLADEAAEAASTSEAEDALRVVLANPLPRTTLRGHDGAVRSAAFDPGGGQVVTGSDNGTARIWDVRSGRVLHTLRGHKGPVTSAAFSPDGRFVVTAGSDGTARIWDAANGAAHAVLRGHTEPVYAAAFNSGSDLLVTASYDGTARIWDTGSGRRIRVLNAKDGPVFGAAFSPDDKLVVTANGYEGAVYLWQVGKDQGPVPAQGLDGRRRQRRGRGFQFRRSADSHRRQRRERAPLGRAQRSPPAHPHGPRRLGLQRSL